jgi:hypothetical protein
MRLPESSKMQPARKSHCGASCERKADVFIH